MGFKGDTRSLDNGSHIHEHSSHNGWPRRCWVEEAVQAAPFRQFMVLIVRFSFGVTSRFKIFRLF